MVQWQQINPNVFNKQLYQFGRQQGYMANNFTPMFPAQTFMPSQSGDFCGGYDFIVQPNPFWGSKFGNFLAGMFGLKIQQPAINSSHIYQNMGLNLNNVSRNESLVDSQSAQAPSNNSNLTLEQKELQHREVVQQSVKCIEEYFDESGLGKHFKTPEDKKLFLQCLKEVVYDKEKQGAGHAEAGIIHIETNNEQCNTLAQMTKLLIHEANHAYLQRKSAQDGTLNFPTKAEEVECETLALKTMSYFVKNVDGMEDYEIYGKNISEYTDAATIQSNPGFKNWLNGYQQLADNLSGDITIQHSLNPDKHSPKGQINIKNGDVIQINGEPPRTIGKDAYLEGCDDTAVTQLIMHKSYYNTPEDERTPDTFGNLIFDPLQATPEELKQVFKCNGDINNFEKIPFTVSRQNPQTGNLEVVYTGYKYILKSN